MTSNKLNDKQLLSIMASINATGTVNVTYFLKEIGLGYASYMSYLRKISKLYPEEYKNYILQNEKNLEDFIKSRKEMILLIEDMLENGIVQDDGSIRKFDILDWYYIYDRYFQRVNRSFMSKLFNELDNENPNNRPSLTRKLVSSSFNDNLGYTYRLIFEKDIREDTYYNLTDFEKERIITHFYRNSIPFCHETFKYAAKRVIEDREKNKELECSIVAKGNNFSFMNDDVEISHRIINADDCFKINKRIR